MAEDEVRNEIPGTMQTVGVLVFSEDNKKVLLVKHSQLAQNPEGIYGLPAGQIELGESPKEAATRELFQETGLKVKEDDLEQFENNFFGSYIIRTKGGTLRHAQMRVFHCNAYEGKVRGDEKTTPEWIEIAELTGLNKMPNIDLAINNYLQAEKNT